MPVDYLAAKSADLASNAECATGAIPADSEGVDIGPKTLALFSDRIRAVEDGHLERPGRVVRAVGVQRGHEGRSPPRWRDSGAVTVVGGGETAEAVEQYGYADKMTHVSTGGGAFLAYVEGKPFASLAQIDDK